MTDKPFKKPMPRTTKYGTPISLAPEDEFPHDMKGAASGGHRGTRRVAVTLPSVSMKGVDEDKP